MDDFLITYLLYCIMSVICFFEIYPIVSKVLDLYRRRLASKIEEENRLNMTLRDIPVVNEPDIHYTMDKEAWEMFPSILVDGHSYTIGSVVGYTNSRRYSYTITSIKNNKVYFTFDTIGDGELFTISVTTFKYGFSEGYFYHMGESLKPIKSLPPHYFV